MAKKKTKTESEQAATVNNNVLGAAINQVNAKMRIMAAIYDFSPEAPAVEDLTILDWSTVLREVANEIEFMGTVAEK